MLADAHAFGTARDRTIILWASKHRDRDLAEAARDAGLRFRSAAVGMAIERPPGWPVVSADVELIRITDSTDVAGFAEVHEHLFAEGGQPAKAVAHFASPAALLASNVSAFAVRVDGQPVSCAMVISTGREAGVYWVATRADARNRGYGELVTRAAVRAGFEHGAHVVVLQATERGRPMYRKMGFVPIISYSRYCTAPRDR